MQEEIFTLKNGKNVTLRHLKAADYEQVNIFLKKIATETIFTNQYPERKNITQEDCEKLYNRNDNCFIGAFDNEGCILSIVNFRINKPGHPWVGRNCEFGISILEKYCGQGLGTHLMQLLEQEAKNKNMHRIYGFVRASNRRAIGLYLKSGFQIDGLFRETAFINGQWHDEYHISKILE